MTPAVETSRGGRTLLILLLLLGIAAFLYGAAVHPLRAWGTYLVNLLFFSSLAITGPAIAGMLELTEARWSPTIKRIAVTTAGFLPFSLLLFIGLFFGRAVLYPWVSHPELAAKKADWLNVPFMAARILLGVFFLYWVALTFTRAVLAEAKGGKAAGSARGVGLDVGPAPETLACGHARCHRFFPDFFAGAVGAAPLNISAPWKCASVR